ncbi:MAG: DinB family protein [Pyrinomonadaceae bacterium]
MNDKNDFLKSLLYLLRETFEGSPDSGSAYLDRGIGVFSTLEKLSAEQVSRETGDTTIAAHTEHFKFYLDRLCEFINGRTEKVNWEQSWLIDDVDETEWDALRGGVKKSYENVLRCLADAQDWNNDKVGMAMGILAHTAYHLGAIRQMTKSVGE